MSQDNTKDTRHAPTLDTINSLNSEGDTDALGDWWDAEQYTVDLTKSPTPGAKSLSVFVVLLSIAVSLNNLCLICCNCKNILIWYCCPVTAEEVAEYTALLAAPGAKSLSVFVVLLSIAVSLNKLCLICCNCKNILIWYCCPVTANKAAEEVADEEEEEEEEEEGDLEVEEEEAEEDEEEANAQGQQGQVAAKQKGGENQKKPDKKGGG